MRITARRLSSIIFLAAASGACRLDAQAGENRAQHTTRNDTAAYSSHVSDFVVGKRVFLRSTKTFIGTITAVDPHRAFPRSFPRPRMDAVLIARASGGRDWVPTEGITRIYVTR